MTYDMWCGVNILLKFQFSSSYGLGQCLANISTKDDLINQLMNDKGVYRTTLASPGLLIIFQYSLSFKPASGDPVSPFPGSGKYQNTSKKDPTIKGS